MIIIVDDEDFDGFEAARAIWENKLHSSFIIIMVSSNDKKGNYMKCITMGIDHYLVKPFDVNELRKMIQCSFSYIENAASSIDIDKLKRDLQILVVEDNKMNQNVTIKMLKSLGYSCDIAEDGYDGYLKAKTKNMI